MLPMVILGVIYNIMFAVSQVIFSTMTFSKFCNNLIGIFTGDAFALAGLWFVYTLAIVKLMSLFIHKNLKPFVAMACIIMAVLLNEKDVIAYNCFVNALLAYPCFYIGELLGNYKEKINRINDIRILCSLIILGLAGTIISFKFNDTVWMYAGGYGGNMVMFILGSVCGTLMCFGLCKLLFNRENKYMLIVAEGTILILALHGLVIRVAHQIEVGWLFYAEAIVLVVAFIPLIKICQEYCPILLGYRGTR